MLHKILSSRNTHSHAVVSSKSNYETNYSDENHFLISSWHFPVQNFEKYSVSVPKSSEIAKVIRNSNIFGVNFLDKQAFESIVPNLNPANSQINHFNLQLYEDQKIKSPILSNSLAHIDCELEKEIEVGDNILFTGRIIGSSFNRDSGI